MKATEAKLLLKQTDLWPGPAGTAVLLVPA